MKIVIEYSYPDDADKLQFAMSGEIAVKALLSIREALDSGKNKGDTINKIDQISSKAILEFKRV